MTRGTEPGAGDPARPPAPEPAASSASASTGPVSGTSGASVTPAPAARTPVSWAAAGSLAAAAGRGPLWLQAGLAAGQALLPLAGLIAMQQLIDAVAAGLAGRVPADVALARATWATVAAGGIAFLGSALRAWTAITAETHGRALTDVVTLRVQAHAAELDLAAFDRPAFHDALQRAGTEASQRPVRLVQDGLAVLTALVALVTMGFWLAGVQPWLPVLVGITALPIAWMRRRHARLRVQWQDENVTAQRDVGYVGAVLTGRATGKDVRVLALGRPFAARLAGLRAGLRESLRVLAGRRGRDELLVTSLGSAGLLVAYYVLARTALAGGLSLGELVLHAQAAQRAQNGVRDLLAALAGVREHRVFLAPLVAFLALRPELRAAPPPVAPPPGPPALGAAALTFRYPEGLRDALRDVAFEVPAGARLALVGANGSGKSTLLKLLARLYDPTAGRLAANGVDLRHADPAAWRARLAVLLQDATLFELSVRDNLSLGAGEPPSEAALWRALDAVGLAAAVRALPAGLDTVCSRRLAGGVDWSSGEQRRLLAARALARPADLLLLDEPFAALDGDAAARLAAALAALPRTCTVVVADHRLECLGFCDQVLALAGGAVVAAGAPAQLAAADPRFAALHRG